MESKTDIQIFVSEEVSKGFYATTSAVYHSPNEFLLEFISNFPPKAVMGSRIILSPTHAKNLLAILQHNVELYERNNGPISNITVKPEMNS